MAGLSELVKRVKPTVLIACSTRNGAFRGGSEGDGETCREVADNARVECESRVREATRVVVDRDPVPTV